MSITKINGKQVRDKYVTVRRLSDFPLPVGNIITLKDDYTYNINGLINIGNNRISLAKNNTIIGSDKTSDKLTYFGNQSMLICTNKDFTIRNLSLESTSGTIFNVTNSNNYCINIENNIFANCLKIGDITGSKIFNFNDNYITQCSYGLDLRGLDYFTYHRNLNSGNISGNILCFNSGNYNVINIQSNHMNVDSNVTGIRLFPSAVVNAAILDSNIFLGSGNYLNGVNGNTTNWNFGVTNYGIAGYLTFVSDFGFTAPIGTRTTTTLQNTLLIDSASNFREHATVVQASLSAEVTGEANNMTGSIQLYNVTDNTLIGTSITFTTTANVYKIVSTPFIQLTQGKSYSIRIVKLSGGNGNNNNVIIRSAKLNLKVY